MKKGVIILLTLLTVGCESPRKRKLDRKTRQINLVTIPINDSISTVEIISKSNDFSTSQSTIIGFSSDQSSEKLIRYVVDSIGVNISSLRKNSPWNIYFQKNSVNNLFALHQFSFELDGKRFINRVNTDFIGPYMVKKTNHSTLSTSKFTGGWHGSNGDATGEATARTLEWKVLDKKANILPKDSLVKYTKKLYIEVVNYIQPNNSKDEVIKETVLYSVHSYGINVFIEIEALADIEFERYYGIQSQNAYFFDELTYNFEDGFTKKMLSISNHQSNDTLNSNRVTHFVLSNKRYPFKMVVWMNPFTKLYKGEYITKNKPWAFTTQYNKSYFNLINGKNLVLKKGTSINLSGGYYFLENN